MSTERPNFPPDPSSQPHPVSSQPNWYVPQGQPPTGEFQSYMKPGSQAPGASAPGDSADTPSSPLSAVPNDPSKLPRAPHQSYPEFQPNGLPNAQYYFHFMPDDVMCDDPYPTNPPNPADYATYPGATVSIKQPDKPGDWEVTVVTLPVPNDPKNPSAKYYNWNYMYVRQGGTQAPWQYCGNGPIAQVGKLPMNQKLWQVYFPWEYDKFILFPLSQQMEQQAQQEEAQRKRREQIYKQEDQ